MNDAPLKAWSHRAATLASLIERAAEIESTRILNMAPPRLRIAFVGASKSGKSTLINALLADDVLPVIGPTGAVTEVQRGEQRYAELHFRRPLPQPLPARLPPTIRDHLSQQGETPAPLRVPVELLDRAGGPETGAILGRIVVSWPGEPAEVVFVDTPGLTGTQDWLAEELARADAVVLTLSCLQLAPREVLDLLQQHLLTSGRCHLVVACNLLDQVPPAQWSRIEDYARQALTAKIKGEVPLVLVSALRSMGIDQLKAVLLRRAIDFANEDLQRRGQRLLELLQATLGDDGTPSPAADPEERSRLTQAVAKELRQSETLLRSWLEELGRFQTRLKQEVSDLTKGHLLSLASRLPDLARALPMQGTMNTLLFWAMRSNPHELAKQTQTHLAAKVEEVDIAWRRQSLQPLIARRFDELQQDLHPLLASLDWAAQILQGLDGEASEPLARRFPGTVAPVNFGALVLPSPGSALPLGMAAAGAVLGLINPLFLVGAAAMSGFLESNIRQEVAKKLGQTLTDEAPKQATQLARQVLEQLAPGWTRLEQTLHDEIARLRARLERLGGTPPQHTAQDQQRRERLAQLVDELRRWARA